MLVVVAVQLQFEYPRVGRCMPLQAAKERCGATKHGLEIDRASAARAIARDRPRVEPGTEYRQGIFDVATRPQVTPAQAQAGIPIAPALASHHILTREQARTTDVPNTQRHLRPKVGLLTQPHFEVDRLVFERLVAGNQGTIKTVGDIAVAKAGLQPIKRLEHDRAARVGQHVAELQAYRADRRHACAGRLQQPNFAPVAGRDLGRTRGISAERLRGDRPGGFRRYGELAGQLRGQETGQVVGQVVRDCGGAARSPDPRAGPGLVLGLQAPRSDAVTRRTTVRLGYPCPVRLQAALGA